MVLAASVHGSSISFETMGAWVIVPMVFAGNFFRPSACALRNTLPHNLMAAIRIQFPDRTEVSVIALTGHRIPIGRSAENSIQIIDRSISLRHAELIEDGDHYRLHDLGSTNGVFVHGQKVTDCPLREPCKLTFGTFECEFLPELPAGWNAPVEALPSKADAGAVAAENSELKAQVTKLREDIAGLRTTVASLDQAGASAVPQEQHEGTLAERDDLKAACSQTERELAHARAELKLLREDRDSFERAFVVQRDKAAALPEPAEVESLRAGNAELKGRMEAATADFERLQTGAATNSEALIALRTEHAALQDAHNRRGVEREQAMEELDSRHESNAELKTRIEAQDRELADLRSARASLSEQAATVVSRAEYTKLAAEHAAAAEERDRLQQEVTRVTQELAALALDNDTLQRISSQQRTELKKLPTPAAFESLRAGNAELRACVSALTGELESLRAMHATHEDRLAASIPLEEHEKLAAENDTLRKAQQQRDDDLVKLTRQFADLQTRQANLEQELGAKEHELSSIKSNLAPVESMRCSEKAGMLEPNGRAALDQQPAGSQPTPPGQLEEALRKLGFRIQPVRLPPRDHHRNGETGSTPSRSD